jgi:hypothetical protein
MHNASDSLSESVPGHSQPCLNKININCWDL